MLLGTPNRILALAGLTAATTCAQATSIFFGEDINPNSTLGVNATIRGPRVNADAAYVSYTGAAPQIGQENFETQTVGAFPSGGSFAFAATGISGTFVYSGSSPAIELIPAAPATIDGGYSSSGSRCISMGYLSTQFATLTLSSPVDGFGFYVTDAELIQPMVTFTYTDSTTESFTVGVTQYPFPNFISGNIAFWGAKTTKKIAKVGFVGVGTTGQDRMFLDQMTILVPEPSTLGAVALAGAGLLVRRRRA